MSKLRSEATIRKDIAEAAHAALEGVTKGEIMKMSKQRLRTHTYLPYSLARLLDMNGGALNLSNIELLRSLETTRKWEKGLLLLSSSLIKLIFKKLEAVAARIIPFKL